jgi:pimeloyl-ACP methyl ester carboxylesterase
MIYYIHGYQSNPNSTKGTLFKKKLNARPIRYRDGPPEDIIIPNCLKKIQEEIKNDNEIILIGSSLGGLLAARIAQINNKIKRIILLNPAIIPPDVDINKIQGMPINILKEMKVDNLFNTRINTQIDIIVGTEDNVVPLKWSLEFAIAQEANLRFLHDDHMLSKNIDNLPNIILKIIDNITI